MSTELRNLQRRLERAELRNLREAVADLARRVDDLETEVAQARWSEDEAWQTADMWRQVATDENKEVTLVLNS
jgi:uncharacterized protein YlxW (UPF0749 family)